MPFYEKYDRRFMIISPALQAVNHRRVLKIPSISIAASITLEAALSLSLFLFFLYLLILPLNMLRVHRQMQALAERVAEHAGQFMYAKNTLLPTVEKSDGDIHATSEEREQIEGGFAFSSILESGSLAAYAQGLAVSEIDDKLVSGINPLGTWYMEEDEMIYVRLNYEYRLPFGIFGFRGIKQSVQSAKRAWVGRDGLKKSEDKPESKELVYVGKTSKRYHKSAVCHYLHNDLSKVSAENAGRTRNRFGRHYEPCARCARGITTGDVYIMPSGTSYHANRSCSAIIAYARQVSLSEVEHLGACSYCSGH